ncbi:MAG TPA: hypothetical protein PLV45_03075 [bacterium]|nr:hypothetical protein [bacterium]
MWLKQQGRQLSTRSRTVIGQLTLVTGIALTMTTRHWGSAIPDFAEGLMVGIAAALIGVSIVFNLSVLPRVRQRFGLKD